ncbi:MAG: FKBP-type peptidyl-prolyl cis-trans isomerase [Bacteroidales bacterium]|jgi:FKBP-type peptidyl-prolyl cis-trans isomerase|nr:FKBP-type peptidyl-prolyl cis-trans isomerase [Bacteroidales bacterium]
MYNNKHIALSILVSATILLASCGGGKPNYKVSLKTDTDSASYYLGINLGTQIANSDIDDFNIDALAKGVQEAVQAGKAVDDQKMQEVQTYLSQYFMNLQTRASAKNLKEGQDFLEENKKKQGVVTLPSGVQYEIVQEGTGAKPTKEDQVQVVYHGTLVDGTVFDSSKERGDTATFNVSGLVPGFTEALTLMNEGSSWKVYIPSELGYGERGAPGGQIKPNSVIIFEIDLVKVNQPEPAEEK